MTTIAQRSTFTARSGNVRSTERWFSVLGGVGLLMSMARGSPLARLARAGAGLTLLSRGAAGYCPMKAALSGERSIGEGYREQWRRLAGTMGARRMLSADTAHIESMEAMYAAELQELHSAESQLASLAENLVRTIGSAELAFRIQEYATELSARKADLDSLVARIAGGIRERPDEAMRALISETHKMTEVPSDKIRDAAVTASIQRIIHYKIAGYGTIASYAKALGKVEEAAHFARLAARDKQIDSELSGLAKKTLNPEAVISPHEPAMREQRPGQMRTH
jgi:ferritin-like metal-binding protein YciE